MEPPKRAMRRLLCMVKKMGKSPGNTDFFLDFCYNTETTWKYMDLEK